LLDESVERYPDNTAIIFPGAFNDESMMSFKELDIASNKLANALVDMGVKKGDRVALLMPNCPQFVISYYAVLRAGGIVVATNPLYSAREMEFQFNDCGAETVIVLSLFYKTVMGIKNRTSLKNVVVTNIKEYLPEQSRKAFIAFVERQEGHYVRVPKVKNIYKFQDLLRRFSAKHTAVETVPDDVAMFQYTGGTTGLSKAAVATHRNVVANVYMMRAKCSGQCIYDESLVNANRPEPGAGGSDGGDASLSHIWHGYCTTFFCAYRLCNGVAAPL
jgi:long-chain acyl-CoA synthetase